jgi:hypothetical protein
MRRANYIVLLALAATPAVVVLAVGRTEVQRNSASSSSSPSTSPTASADLRRPRWEYRVVAERDMTKASDASTILAGYLADSGDKPQRWRAPGDNAAPPPADAQQIQQLLEDAAQAATKDKESKLNDMGTQGWELVAVDDHALIFRRIKN